MYRRTSPYSTHSVAAVSLTLRSAAGAVFITLGCMSSAQAQNLGFMHDSPITFMKQKDMASLTEALNGVLDNSPDGQTSEWTNTGLGNAVPISGTMTPKDRLEDQGMKCRHVAIQLTARNQQQAWQPLFCKTSAGWKLQKR
jgi:surface antigen